MKSLLVTAITSCCLLSLPVSSEETLPESGYTKYQRERSYESLIELESYGASVRRSGIGITKIYVDSESLIKHIDDFARVLVDESPEDIRGKMSAHIFYHPKSDLRKVLSRLETGFSTIVAIPSNDLCDTTNSTNKCDAVEIHLL
tara:strand:+ start:647 stop:1081 length:435 start_codon:yes stop_codon:yes gene_type:complete